MGIDLAPYDLIDEVFQEEEQQTLVLRLLQAAPEGFNARTRLRAKIKHRNARFVIDSA